MSYILDALRKADAERERGAVPGIHDQTMFAGVPQFGERGAGRPWWIWLVVAVALVLLVVVAVLVWNMRGAQPSRSVADATASGRVSSALPATPASASATMPVPAAAPPVEAARPVPARKAKVANAAASANAGAAANSGTGAVSKANVESSPKSNVGAAPPPAAASAPSVTVTRIYQLSELPEDIRRQVPEITVGGSMYSNVPANRILIINGTVFHEGDKLAPDLVLQQIRLKAAVISFKDYRYLISF